MIEIPRSTSRLRWKTIRRLERIFVREHNKALVDAYCHGIGFVKMDASGDIRHLPVGLVLENGGPPVDAMGDKT